LAGANTCVYSNPNGELGPTQHNAQTSNRRFRDDEFLIARDLTRGKQSIRIRVKFTPMEVPLFPGHPLPELAWSEIRYDAYCYVLPDFEPRGRTSAGSKASTLSSQVAPVDWRHRILPSEFEKTNEREWTSGLVQPAFAFDELIYSWPMAPQRF